jgi:tetratricopeptide (TPR) repeat protein
MIADGISKAIEFRHFRAIRMNWTVDRPQSHDSSDTATSSGQEILEVDSALSQEFAGAFCEPLSTESSESPRQDTTNETGLHILNLRARNAVKQGRIEEAISLATEATELSDKNPGLCEFLGCLYALKGSEIEARKWKLKADEIRSNSAWVHLQNARWLIDKEPYAPDKITEELRTAIDLEPELLYPYVHLALYLAQLGEFSEAKRAAKKATELAPENLITHILMSQVLLAAGEVHNAAKFAECAVDLDGANPVASHQLATCLVAARHFEDALREQRKALKKYEYLEQEGQIAPWALGRELGDLTPEELVRVPKAYLSFQLGKILNNLGRSEMAERALQYAITTDPERPEFYAELSFALNELGRKSDAEHYRAVAIDSARKLVDRPPRFALTDAHNERDRLERLQFQIYILSILQEPERALAAAQRAVELFPENPQAHFLLASQYRDSGQLEHAIESGKNGIALSPNSSRLAQLLATLLLDTGNSEQVESILSAFGAEPADLHIVYLRARALAAQGRVVEATESVRAALSQDESNPKLNQLLAELIAREQEDLADVESLLQKSLGYDPTDIVGVSKVVQLLGDRDRRVEAFALAGRLGAAYPLNAYLADYLGGLAAKSGEFALAEWYQRRAVRILPEIGHFLWRLASILVANRRYQEALEVLDRAVKQLGQSADLLAIKGIALAETGDLEAAESVFRKVLELRPNDATARNYLGKFTDARSHTKDHNNLPSSLDIGANDLSSSEINPIGLFDDGWSGRAMSLSLFQPPEAVSFVVKGAIPRVGRPGFTTDVEITVDGKALTNQRLEAGEFTICTPTESDAGIRQVKITFDRTQTLPAPDSRVVGARLTFLGYVSEDCSDYWVGRVSFKDRILKLIGAA